MGGVRNFAHFAADSTLDLLSRRRVLMWFVTDRDELQDQEVKRMMERIGARAKLKVLERRELENYLLSPDAIATFVTAKLMAAKKSTDNVNRNSVSAALDEAFASLKPEVIRLRLERDVLTSIHLQSRHKTGTAEDRIKAAKEELENRLKSIDDQRRAVEATVSQSWDVKCAEIVPGALVLGKVAGSFGVKFSKEAGDSEKAAVAIPAEAIPSEIKALWEDITR
jgi:putative ATP-dependent endonuclease of OLD family